MVVAAAIMVVVEVFRLVKNEKMESCVIYKRNRPCQDGEGLLKLSVI